MITLKGEVTSIGRSATDRNSQRIEVDLTGENGVQYSTLYLTFKGGSPYALDDQVVVVIGTPREIPSEPTTK